MNSAVAMKNPHPALPLKKGREIGTFGGKKRPWNRKKCPAYKRKFDESTGVEIMSDQGLFFMNQIRF
jgi:hypothetical protein